MFTEQFFDLLLDFGDEWAVKEVTTNLETNEIEIYVEYFGSAQLCDYAPARRWRHLDTMQFQTFLNCRLPRVKLANGQVQTVPPPWANKHDRHSYLFESAVISLLLATKNQTQTANLMRCSFAVVNRILHSATERGLERRSTETVIENLSIDEKAFQKGHRSATILSDPETGGVLEVVETRTKQACQGLLDKALTQQQQASVKTISMDLWQAFIAVGEEKLPQAEIVHDKFHLVKYLTDAIDKVRRREVKEHTELKSSRYALLKNEANLTEKQRVKFAANQSRKF